MSEDVMDFADLPPESLKVTNLHGKNYILWEASEGAVIKWRGHMLGGTTAGPDGKPNKIDISGAASSDSFLVQQCIKEVTKNGEKEVSMQVVRSWQPRVIKKLFAWIKEHSDLDMPEKGGEDPIKNGEGSELSPSPSVTADTSA